MTSAAERAAALTKAHSIAILSAYPGHYLGSFLEQGFDTWDSILDITEPDFDVLGVKLGHRRKLQRRIAATRGVRHGQALASPKRSSSGLDDKLLEGKGVTTSMSEGKDGRSSSMQPSKKRKYTRHPRPDENAPARPRSAYVIFSNKMREDLMGKSLSFTEIAKLASLRRRSSYKQLHTQDTSQESPNETSKVPKLQKTPSAISTGTAKCSTTSSLSHEVSSDMSGRGLSLDSIPGPWFSSEHVMQTAMQTAVVPSTLNQASAGGPNTTLTGYCDTVIRAPQTLARRNHARPTDIPILEYSGQNKRNASQPRILNGPDTGALEFHKAYPRRTGVLSMDYSISKPSQRSGYFSSPQTAHSYSPASLQQHNTPTRLHIPRSHQRAPEGSRNLQQPRAAPLPATPPTEQMYLRAPQGYEKPLGLE
ncbi:hypothetical protein V496_01577 [Pseudogymnoascus sp. VKM F-4515 (FW-2607)]|nr:hypothetical protein V496_01577 [Pseudogymnoascus sp. VKM F-4515 (FW-2607)]